MMATLAVSALSLAAAGLTEHATAFFVISALIGFSSVSVQMLIPLAAHLAPDATRGRVVGSIMGGLLLGILLARPLSSLAADHFGWRAVFFAAAALMLVIIVVVRFTLPERKPAHKASYLQLLVSLERLFRTENVLRRRSIYQALMFAAFSLFWTAVPLELTRELHLSQSQIALFALMGAMGAIAAPIAGRLADAGHTHRASWLAMTLAVLSFSSIWVLPGHRLAALAVTAVLLDFAVQMNMVLGQREVYALNAAERARLNALYMTSIFIGGAAGSIGASWLYDHGGWSLIAGIGMALPAVALAAFWLHTKGKKTTALEIEHV
jgi:predicted MFS family arabinose efflux permease